MEKAAPGEGKLKVMKQKTAAAIQFPYCGTAIESLRVAVTYSDGLFVQCTTKHEEEKQFYKGCHFRNDNGQLALGTMVDRELWGGRTHVAPDGATPVHYMEIMQKRTRSRTRSDPSRSTPYQSQG